MARYDKPNVFERDNYTCTYCIQQKTRSTERYSLSASSFSLASCFMFRS